MSDHIVELHHELQEKRQEAEEDNRIRAYMASFEQNQLTRADRHRAARRKFLATGNLSDDYNYVPGTPGAVYAIYQS